MERNRAVSAWFGWPIVLIVTLIAVFIGLWLQWLIGPQPFGWLSAVGIVTGFVGLVISFFGFGITIQQLRRTATAALAASEAVTKLRKDFSSFDVIGELRTLIAAAEDAQSVIVEQRWAPSLVLYKRIHTSLNRIISIRDALNQELTEEAKDYVAQALGACATLEGKMSNPEIVIEPATLPNQLRNLIAFLIRVEISLKEQFGG